MGYGIADGEFIPGGHLKKRVVRIRYIRIVRSVCEWVYMHGVVVCQFAVYYYTVYRYRKALEFVTDNIIHSRMYVAIKLEYMIDLSKSRPVASILSGLGTTCAQPRIGGEDFLYLFFIRPLYVYFVNSSSRQQH